MRIAAIAMVLSACAVAEHEPPIVQLPDDARLRMFVEQSAQEWTDVGCPIYLDPDDGVQVSLVTKADWTFGEKAGGYWDGRNVFVRAETSDGLLHGLLLHEFGHMLGFPHRDYGVMLSYVVYTRVVEADCTGVAPD